jgi:spermidine synthase
MDAFLKPSRDTDTTGVPLRLKTLQFYKELQSKLTADGMVVFNINPHPTVRNDLKIIQEAFPQTYVFNLPGYGGMVVIASMNRNRPGPVDLFNSAGELDRRLPASYSYRDMVRHLER